MDGVDTYDSIRTPTITTTLSHETVNTNIEGPTDIPQLLSLSPSHNLMTLSYLATSISPSFSLQSYGLQGTQPSGRVEQQPINEITSVTNAAAPSVSPNKKHYLLKLFIEKTSSWVVLSHYHG
jgi:hypothetical protein